LEIPDDLTMVRKIVSRVYNNNDDFTAVMRFLYDTFMKTNSYQNWFPDRFENSLDTGSVPLVDDIRVWEEVNDETIPTKKAIVAIANPEGSRERSD